MELPVVNIKLKNSYKRQSLLKEAIMDAISKISEETGVEFLSYEVDNVLLDIIKSNHDAYIRAEYGNLIIEEETHVAVICADGDDFYKYLKTISNNIKEHPNRFKSATVDGNVYYKICRIGDSISKMFDSIIETENAKLNPRYHELLQETKPCLKQKQKRE